MRNLDERTARGFDSIWKRYGMDAEKESGGDDEVFEIYFRSFPVERLTGAEGFDLGCGNGRIARSIAPRVGFLHCIDPSPAGLAAAKHAIGELKNVSFHEATVDTIPLPDCSQDFGYSIGVLHHLPDPSAGLSSCVKKLKHGTPFLVYLYYSLDNRPVWFRAIWRISNLARIVISRVPFTMRPAATSTLAAVIYWPFARTARILRKFGIPTDNIPLSFYMNRPWADLRADALDRFGTAVEHRFSRAEIEAMMLSAGLENVHFAEGAPFWVAVGYKR